jgi:hypothetical protein
MAVIERTCDRCARFAEDCTVIEDAYICGGCRAEIAAEEAEVEALRRQLRGAVDLLRDVANSAPEFEDPRMGYVVVQIDRPTWEELAPYRTGGQ